MTLYRGLLSEGGELLVNGAEKAVDVLIVGSGYGGAVAAARLAGLMNNQSNKPLSVYVLERGQEYLPGTFPTRFADLPRHVRINRFDTPELTGEAGALFDFRISEEIGVLVGNGLGGGSLINAGVVEMPTPDVFQCDHWPEALQERGALDGHYRRAVRMLRATRKRTPGPELTKYKEFASWAKGIGLSAQPARVAVTFSDSPGSGHDATRKACKNCGDCFTGCNHDAKNTLPMTYLWQARAMGAKLFTGVTVSHITPATPLGRDDDAAAWRVHFRLTSRKREKATIVARQVVLAAGTLGSTEILLRSREEGLVLSKRLGRRFSCNGDMISSLYGQKRPVNAAPHESARPGDRGVGPTITGIARKDGERGDRFVVEELAIPGALRRVFEEVVTTMALPHRLGRFDYSLHGAGGKVDPAAVDPDAVDCTQVLAAMGEDSAKGQLELIRPTVDTDLRKVADGAVTVNWPRAGLDPVYALQDRWMSRPTDNRGIYLPNPLWRPLPDGLSARLQGARAEGKVFSVHPLGGCPMADDAARGVVNDTGQVFRKLDGAAVYENLLVLDGSIVPSALGINPLLTITALAERAIAANIERKLDCGEWRAGSGKPVVAPPDPEPDMARQPKPAVTTELRFAERVTGSLRFVRGGEMLPVELSMQFKPKGNVPDFLRNPARALVLEQATLSVKPSPERAASTDVPVTGNVALLERGVTMAPWRVFRSLCVFGWQRGVADVLAKLREKRPAREVRWYDVVLGCLGFALTPVFALLASLVCVLGAVLVALRLLPKNWLMPALFRFEAVAKHWLERWITWRSARWIARAALAIPRLLASAINFLIGLGALASHVGEVRRLCYSLTLCQDLKLGTDVLPAGTRLVGRKIVRYSLTGNPWRQVVDLPISIERRWRPALRAGTLSVDLQYFFKRYATQLQVTRQQDLPSTLMDLASLSLFLGRMLAKIHFWSFRLPEYERHDPGRTARRLPGPLSGLQMRPYTVDTIDEKTGVAFRLPLTRYWMGVPGKPVVLFHGLGASGNQFATPRLRTNLVQYLAYQGRDVWVAEMRHSIAVPSSLRQWTLDEVAHGDIPRIVRKVLLETNADSADVVAHCIGSAMFCIAALDGRLQHSDGRSMVNNAVLMQVGPIIRLSPGTTIRAYLAAFLRRYVMETFVDFSIDDSADWLDSLIDRVLTTYPYPPAEARHHRLLPPWKPHTHQANCNRWAAIDGRMIVHENLDPLMLESLGEILGHANITTWEQTIQYAYLERLTDAEARNSYVTEENIRSHFKFPVRFIHGVENDVFSVETSRRSRQLLLDVFGSEHPCDVKEMRNYSHLDPLIGRNAYRDVYPHIGEFLGRAHVEAQPSRQPRILGVRRPLIGPLVGWTRKEGSWTARVWCRVDDTRSPCSGVIAVPLERGNILWPKIRIWRPTRGRVDTLATFDVELEGSETDYEVVIASLHESDATGLMPCASRPLLPEEETQYRDVIEARVKQRATSVSTGGKPRRDRCAIDPDYDDPLDTAVLRGSVLAGLTDENRIHFAFGSCRYGASVVDRERADAVFGPLRSALEVPTGETPSLLLLIGDQIYSDQTAGVFDPRGRRERFYEAYREAWTAPNLRAVLSRVPTYMMLDDHEVGDNWHPGDELTEAERRLRRHGLEAFEEYQLLHSPHKAGAPAEGYAYAFKAAASTDSKAPGFAFFVCDARSTRSKDAILSEQQWEKLKAWLLDQPGDKRPKFIVSSSVVVPFQRDSGPDPAYARRSDGWDAYPHSLRDLFQVIRDNNIHNVVFLCGDAHLSLSSEIWFENASGKVGPAAYCIVASPLYAPFPFANAKLRDYVPDNKNRAFPLANGEVMRYQVTPGSQAEDADGYTLVSARNEGGIWKLDARMVGPGGQLTSVTYPGSAVAGIRVDSQRRRASGGRDRSDE